MSDWRAVKVTTPPASDPVSVDDFNDHLRRETSDVEPEQGLLERSLAAAIAQLEGPDGIGVALLPQTWTLTLDAFPTGRGLIYLPGAPFVSVTSIKYDDAAGQEQTLADTAYRVGVGMSPARVQPVNGWPATIDGIAAVRVEYAMGYTDAASVPADLIGCLLLMASTLYELRGFTPGEGGEMPWPPQARFIRDKYRQGFAA